MAGHSTLPWPEACAEPAAPLPAAPAAEPSEARPEASDEPLAVCWNRTAASPSDVLFGGALAAAGLGSLSVGAMTWFQDPSRVAGSVTLGVVGVVLLLAGLFLLLQKWLGPNQGIEVDAEGIEVITLQSARRLLWRDIEKVLTLDFCPHRGADLRIVVTIEPASGRPIKFDTAQEGDPLAVLHYLETNCDYVVRNPRGYTKRTR